LASGSAAVQTLTGNSGGAISPTAGNINTVGTGSITVVGSGFTLTTQLTGLTNHAVQVGAGTATLTQVGPSATTGAVLASNGAAADPSFQTISSLGGITSITGNSGGAEVPLSGNFNILGTGSITVVGSANTETVELTGLTNHNVLVGAGTATITNVAPSATAGIPLVSNGSSSDPSFTTAVVAGGGTGNTTFTAYSVICAGTTATGAFQNVSGLGSSGNVLTSNGAGALPTWQAAASSGFKTINVQVFTGSGTYTPTANMKYCFIQCVGGGGGGAGNPTTGATTTGVGGGGGSGAYTQKVVSAATIGASQTVTIGALGTGSTGNAAGNAGTASSVGTIVNSGGGAGGGSQAASAVVVSAGSAGGAATTPGDLGVAGTPGGSGFSYFVATPGAVAVGGFGGSSYFGGGGGPGIVSGSSKSNGGNGQAYGAGGGGSASGNSQGAAATGGNGVAGVVIITEYI